MPNYSQDTPLRSILALTALTVVIGVTSPPTWAESSSLSQHSTQKGVISETQTKAQTEAINTSVPQEQVDSYHYPPYQTGNGQPVEITYYAPGAAKVALEAGNQRTGETYHKELNVNNKGVWTGQIPTTFFKDGDSIQMMFTPVSKEGLKLGSPEQVINYKALQEKTVYQAAATLDRDLSKLLVVPFQTSRSDSPAFNIYWPELYYAQSTDGKAPTPLAARVQSTRSPENSVRKLDPIQNRPGWFQFQVPTLWFSPGEDITVDFTSQAQQEFSKTSDYPLPSNASLSRYKPFISKREPTSPDSH